MDSKNGKDGVSLFLALLAMYAAVFGARHWWLARPSEIRLETGKADYLHFEYVDIALTARDPDLAERFQASPPRVAVRRDGRRVTTVAGISEVRLDYDTASGRWTGRWPCPWNAPVGAYTLELLDPLSPEEARRFATRPFRIVRRPPHPLPAGFAVVTLESVVPFETMKVRAPDGTLKDWRGLLDWVQYVGADAFWVLGGQTPGEKPGLKWVDYNFGVFPEMAQEAHARGLKFGLYAECYLTMSKERLPGYVYARDVKDGEPVETRSISISDPSRPGDVAALLKRFRDIPGVDFVGVDYIRNALGGYELAGDFYADMPGVRPPPGWINLTREERMVYLARKKIMRKDQDFIDAWQWWRAHRVAEIVRRIKSELGEATPLWAFSLTWQKGWQHGQDPVMMNDAGVDADALMLYEADDAQFNVLLRDWHDYVRTADAQLIVGNIVDWTLHQKPADGPKAFGRRLRRAIDGIYSDGPARGVFIHDLGRALWGHLGKWSTREWMDEAREAVKHLRAARRAA